MDLYNVGWIIAHSDETKAYLDSYPDAEPGPSFKQVKTYKLRRSLNYFVKGDGRVKQRGHNNVVLSDLSGSEVIVKFHLVPGLTSEPPTVLTPVKFLDDPTPFVKLLNPPKELKLFFP
jgi:hypothetical protein